MEETSQHFQRTIVIPSYISLCTNWAWFVVLCRSVNTNWEETTFLPTATLDLVSKNTLIWESSTIHPLVSTVWISTSYLVVPAWMSLTGAAKLPRSEHAIVLLKKMLWNGSKLNTMELSSIARNNNFYELINKWLNFPNYYKIWNFCIYYIWGFSFQ